MLLGSTLAQDAEFHGSAFRVSGATNADGTRQKHNMLGNDAPIPANVDSCCLMTWLWWLKSPTKWHISSASNSSFPPNPQIWIIINTHILSILDGTRHFWLVMVEARWLFVGIGCGLPLLTAARLGTPWIWFDQPGSSVMLMRSWHFDVFWCGISRCGDHPTVSMNIPDPCLKKKCRYLPTSDIVANTASQNPDFWLRLWKTYFL